LGKLINIPDAQREVACSEPHRTRICLFKLILGVLGFKARATLEAENLVCDPS
jgi:hypothetical protein